MNELETQLAELVKKGIEVAETTGNFVIDQAPLLLQEFYRWHIMKCSLGIFLALMLLLLSITILKLSGKKESFKEFGFQASKFLGRYYSMDAKFISGIFSGTSFIAFVILLSINIYKLTFIIVAPKLYLIDYFIK